MVPDQLLKTLQNADWQKTTNLNLNVVTYPTINSKWIMEKKKMDHGLKCKKCKTITI